MTNERHNFLPRPILTSE